MDPRYAGKPLRKDDSEMEGRTVIKISLISPTKNNNV
jgi:hypothetical protein